MLHVQPPPSTQSSLISGHNQSGNLYRLPQLRDFGGSWGKAETSRGGDAALRGWPRGYTEQSLIPSPRIQTSSMNGQPVIPASIHSQPLQSARVLNNANTLPYPTPQHPRPGHSRQNSKPQPFYQSYYSARQHPSPGPKKDEVSSTSEREQQSARRKGSADLNTIAANLQIPSTINDSKGSLPEFAAQITCLFWFESSLTLQLIQDVRSPQLSITALSPEANPTMGFRKWVTTILSMTQVSQNVILLALMFIYRLKILNPGVKGKVGSEFRLLTVALMLGNKFLDDNTYTNKTWAEVSGISVQEIHVMEVEFLSNMRYSLYASEGEWNEWHTQLGRFADYVDRAAQIPKGYTSPSFISAATPSLVRGPNLPSPPTSQQTSPAFGQPPHTTSGALHPTSMAPFLPPAIASPASLPPPEADVRQWTRKRSIEDNSLEPPAKRLSAYNSHTHPFAPSTRQEASESPVPRLPVPAVSSAAYGNGLTPSSGPLPPPTGRAMSTVFPGPGRWPQSKTLPSLQPPQYLNPAGSNGGSPANDMHSRPASLVQPSTTSSPTAYSFPAPHHPHTPAGLSPSGMPFPRNSPYKPVRRVNTLLVPPPSASLHHVPQQLSFEQMHYQPLGKPVSERRTGVLPYLPFETWSQSHQMQHYLPQPQLPQGPLRPS